MPTCAAALRWWCLVVVSGGNARDARDARDDGNPLPSPFSWQVRCDLHVFQSRQGQLLRWCPVLCHEFCCHIMRPGSTVKPCGNHWDPFWYCPERGVPSPIGVAVSDQTTHVHSLFKHLQHLQECVLSEGLPKSLERGGLHGRGAGQDSEAGPDGY